jgi:hypothetical protein
MSRGAFRGKYNMKSAIKSHFDRVDAAIKTGDMSKVKSANRTGYNEEKRSISSYSAGAKR